MFEISFCSAAAEKHFARSRLPVILNDNMGFAWIAAAQTDDRDISSYPSSWSALYGGGLRDLSAEALRKDEAVSGSDKRASQAACPCPDNSLEYRLSVMVLCFTTA